MPLVVLTRDPKQVSDEAIRALLPALQRYVAEALNTPNDEAGHLTVGEVEVRVREPGLLDLNASPFGVEVFANHVPARAENIGVRTNQIARELRGNPHVPLDVIDDKGGFVWVILGVAGFEKL